MRSKIIFIIMLSAVCGNVFSQQANGNVLRLTVSEAKDFAVKHNKSVWNTGLSVSEAQKRTWEVISAGLPQVNASVDYQNLMGFSMSFAGFDIALPPTSNFQAQVTQLLFSASYWVGIKMSKIGEEMTETARLQAELDVKQQTQSACYAVLVARENKTILEQNLVNLEAIAVTTEGLVRAGVAEQTDVDQIKVQVLTMTNVIKSIERNVELAQNLLRFQLGVDGDTEIVLTQTLDDLMVVKNPNALLATDFDLYNNYNVRLLEGQIDLANKQVSLEKAAGMPSAAAFYNYTYKIAKSTFDMSPNNVIGLQVNIPISGSGHRHARTQQAKINLKKAQNNFDLITESLLLQEKQLRFNLNSAIETLAMQKEAKDVAQRVFESITRKYQYGTASSLDVTTANISLLQAQGNYINAMMDVFTAQTELEKLLNAM